MIKLKKRLSFLLALIVITGLNCTLATATNLQEKKTVYLTFDDGPSNKSTQKIINILNKNNVKATFFVVGGNINNCKKSMEALKKNDMAVYPHCNIHTYNKIYSSEKKYFDDLSECEKKIQNVMGAKGNYNFIRLPGGSKNSVAKRDVLKRIKNSLIDKGKYFIDWNIDSGDAREVRAPSQRIKNNVKSNAGKYKVDVILMHDSDCKDTTVESLQEIIDKYKALGYEFKDLRQITKEEIAYLRKTDVINGR